MSNDSSISWGIKDVVIVFFITAFGQFVLHCFTNNHFVLGVASPTIMLASTLLWVLKYRGGTLRELGLSSKEVKKYIVLGVGVGFFTFISSSLKTLHILGVFDHKFVFQHNSIVAMLEACPIYLLASFNEEIFTRGFFYQALRERLGVTSAIILSALAFGLGHFYLTKSMALLSHPYSLGLARVLSNFLFGVIMAVLFQRTKTLAAPISAHATSNLLASRYSVFIVVN